MMSMNVIDAHLHLNQDQYPNIEEAFADLQQQLIESEIDKGLLLHLEVQNYELEHFKPLIKKYDRIEAFVNLNPYCEKAPNKLSEAYDKWGFIGLKLHPRLQNISLMDYRTIRLCQLAGDLNFPVLIDAFPDGSGLLQGFESTKYALLAKACPKTRFIWAHMGGHKVIDFMMLAKRCSNVWMDCSYSLLYYRSSAVTQNLIYAMKSMGFNRIFYGSDYPDRKIKVTLEESLKVFYEFDIKDEPLKKILYYNAKEFFSW